jgi:hypothetical protein
VDRAPRDAEPRRRLAVGESVLADQQVGIPAALRKRRERALAELRQLLFVHCRVGLHPRMRALRELAHEVLVRARAAIGAPQLIERSAPSNAAHETGETGQVDWRRALPEPDEQLENDVLCDVSRRFGADDPGGAAARDGGDLEKETGFGFGVQRGGDLHGYLQLKSDERLGHHMPLLRYSPSEAKWSATDDGTADTRPRDAYRMGGLCTHTVTWPSSTFRRRVSERCEIDWPTSRRYSASMGASAGVIRH